jgi:hypothetical protein
MARCDLTLATAAPPWSEPPTARASPPSGVGGRQLDHGDRRDRRHRRRRPQHAPVEDLRLRLGLLGRRQPARRRPHLRPASSPSSGPRAATSPRAEQKALARAGHVGTTTAPASSPPWPKPAPKLAAAAGFDIADDRTVHRRRAGRDRPRAPVLGREAHHAPGRPTATTASTTPWPRSARSTRWPARATPAASTPFDDDHIDALRAGGAREPHHGPPTPVEGQRRVVHQRHAHEPRAWAAASGAATSPTRTSASSHYLNVTWVSRPDPRGPAVRAGAVRRLLRNPPSPRRPVDPAIRRRGRVTMGPQFSLAPSHGARHHPLELIEIAARRRLRLRQHPHHRRRARRAGHPAGG